MQPIETLTVRAAELARSSPQRWADFLTALAAYTDTHRNNLLSSPVSELQGAQGRAQSMASLCDTLKKCEETADKIAKKGRP